MYAYTNLFKFGWALGVHKSPIGYEHPWLVVYQTHTEGYWTRREAREAWANRDEVTP